MGFKATLHDRLMERRQSPPARIALELLSSAVASARARQLCRMRLDGPRWIHSYRDGAMVTPTGQPDLPPPAEISARMRDEFCHFYVPRPGDVVIDVGAGIGEALLLFSSLVGPGGKVIAIEAHPLIYGCLERAVEVNRLTNVELVHAAVTGEPGPVTITDEIDFGRQPAAVDSTAEAEAPGPGWYGNTIVGSSRDGTIEVEGRTLDQIVSDAAVDEIGLLKMNIEGAEGPALPGMGKAIAGCRAAAISCHDFRVDETGDEAFRTKGAVRSFLERNGFLVKSRDHDPNPSTRDVVYGVREGVTAGAASPP